MFSFFGGSQSQSQQSQPSILADWNKYQSGDVETGFESPTPATSGATGGIFNVLQQGVQSVRNTVSSSVERVETTRQNYVLGLALILGGCVLIALAVFIFLPMIVLVPSKFALCFSLGSLLVLCGGMQLGGFTASLKHMFSSERIWFTVGYVGSLTVTIAASTALKSWILSIIFSIVQAIALAYYLVSYFPGGIQALQSISSMAVSLCTSCLRSGYSSVPSG